MKNFEDITGKIFGNWKTIKRDKELSKLKDRSYWICECKCGNIQILPLCSLKSGNNKQCINCYNSNRKKTGCGQISGTYWANVRAGAKTRKLSFDISIEYAWGLFLKQDEKCALSGKDLYFKKRKTGSTASLDRIDSTKGYVCGNIQWVHKNINKSKMNLKDKDFVQLCHNVSSFQKKVLKSYNEVIPTLKKYTLVDGLDIVIDLQKSYGSWIVDGKNGKKYLDCFANFSSQPVGWNHPDLISRNKEFIKVSSTKIAHSDIYTEHYSKFLENFSSTLNEFSKFFFIAGGALAVENALKAAFDWKTQKLGIENDQNAINQLDIVHFENAFHGRSGYTLSLTNTSPDKTKWFPKFNWTRLSVDDKGLQNLENNLKNNKTAAVIIEPIQAEGGDIHINKIFLKNLYTLTRKYESLLIFDEVQTGWSTGKMWCYQHFNIIPDLIAFGKKVQVCGFASTNRINEVKNNVMNTSGRINSTWGPDIVDLVRSQIIMDIIEKYNLIENSQKVGNYFLNRLQNLQSKEITEVRGKGLMLAFDLPNTDRRDEVINKLSENMLALTCGKKSIRFRPHLTFSLEDVDYAIKFINKSLI